MFVRDFYTVNTLDLDRFHSFKEISLDKESHVNAVVIIYSTTRGRAWYFYKYWEKIIQDEDPNCQNRKKRKKEKRKANINNEDLTFFIKCQIL